MNQYEREIQDIKDHAAKRIHVKFTLASISTVSAIIGSGNEIINMIMGGLVTLLLVTEKIAMIIDSQEIERLEREQHIEERATRQYAAYEDAIRELREQNTELQNLLDNRGMERQRELEASHEHMVRGANIKYEHRERERKQ